QETNMVVFDETTFYYPYATSLRMSDIGYQNSKEDKSGINVSYHNVAQYTESLRHAITTPYAPYAKMGVKVNGVYEQLNANLLQIENEYYSPVRPKQLADNLEMPINALRTRGVKYIELRSLDINVFEPTGVSDNTLYFLEAFFLFCLFHESPEISEKAHQEIGKNTQDVARMGRKPGLMLQRGGKRISLKHWATEIFEQMQGVCELLDKNSAKSVFSDILAHYQTRICDPDATPSAHMLAEMRENKEGFYAFSLRKSEEYLAYYKRRKLSPEREAFFRELSTESRARQREIEAGDRLGFDQFLADYFKQAAGKF
ncbi:MAG TPA: glutamate--cysteine ligase, partial [Gammaproteobacteria bacterium]|nr:glutamate--cysteine ligase [Gammaproteobacteria bacterium]